MPHHFSPEEFKTRQSRTRQALVENGLDAILLFAPESHYWLTGYDTFGFAMFQCLVLTARGELHLLTRRPDLRQQLVDDSSLIPACINKLVVNYICFK